MLLEQLRAGGAEKQEWHARRPLREVRQEFEEWWVGPVQVFDDDDSGTVRGDRFHEALPGGEGLFAGFGLAGVDSEQREQSRPQPVALLDLRKCCVELRGRRLRRIGLEDPGVRLDQLAERPERDPLAVRQAATLTPSDQLGTPVEVARKLRTEPALADPGLAHERHELDGRVARAPNEQALEERLLDFTTDEQRLLGPDQVRAEPRARLDGSVQTKRRTLPLDVHRHKRLVDDDSLGLPERLLRNRHLVHGRGRLNARRRVHDVAGDDPLTLLGSRVQRNDCGSGVDTDPHLELELGLSLVQLGDRLDDPKPCADCPLGIVLVRDRRAENSHDGIADELLDRAAVALELVPHARVIRANASADILGVGILRGCREADQVAEENRNDLPLLVSRRDGGGQRAGAIVAEPRAVGVLRPAPWADHRPSLVIL